MASSIQVYATGAIAVASIVGVLLRPRRLPEYVFALIGAAAMVLSGLLPPGAAIAAVAKGADVYFFLIGMMLLSEMARQEGVFDWAASHAVRFSRGSSRRLFGLIYLIGTIVTIFLSNDATAVVLTPAVYAAAKKARVEPMPFLYICAFIANAASFVLPISNPANLVVFASRMPPLADWIKTFTLPSIVAISVTFGVLRVTLRTALAEPVSGEPDAMPLSMSGRLAFAALTGTAIVLLTSSALGRDLGLPTFACGVVATALITGLSARSPVPLLRAIAWSVVPFVAGLFVLVAGLEHAGAVKALASLLREGAARAPGETAFMSGLTAGFTANLVNNLPLGLLVASASHAAATHPAVTAGLLIGVDLGPNLSVAGSLATLLWLIAIRREGERVDALRFLALGALVMPPGLLLSLLALVVQ